MTQLQKLTDNISALRVATNGGYSPYTEEEKLEILSKYSGFGSIKCILFGDGTYQSWKDQGASESDLKLHEPIQKLFNLLIEHYGPSEYRKVLNSLKNSVLSAFFTPAVIPATFYEVLKEFMEVKSIYEPSAGSGIFITEAFKVFPQIENIYAYEKDLITAKVLTAIVGKSGNIYSKPFEESSEEEKCKFDLITSNIPFGDIKIYDPKFSDNNITGKVHNYFFAKGIDKIKDGGVLAFLTTSSFLDTVSNKTSRKYLFDRCDFISLVVMPDNLYWESAGTMAPSHFLVVQKNSTKTCLSQEEELLVESEFREIDGKKIAINNYLYEDLTVYFKDCVIGKQVIGKNQYGRPAIEVKWDKPISEIVESFAEILRKNFATRFKEKEEVPADPVFLVDTEFDEDDDEESYAPGNGNDIVWDSKRISSKTTEKAIDNCGLSDMFKIREEWEMTEQEEQILEQKEFAQQHEDSQDQPTTGTEPNKFKWEGELPEYIQFKDGLIVEL